MAITLLMYEVSSPFRKHNFAIEPGPARPDIQQHDACQGHSALQQVEIIDEISLVGRREPVWP
jgi:hypothetical protein